MPTTGRLVAPDAPADVPDDDAVARAADRIAKLRARWWRTGPSSMSRSRQLRQSQHHRPKPLASERPPVERIAETLEVLFLNEPELTHGAAR
jgi:hypothetical protein